MSQGVIRTIFEKLPVKIDYLVAILLMLWSGMNLYQYLATYFDYGIIYWQQVGEVSAIFAFAIIIAILPNKTITKTVGMTAIALCFYLVTESYNLYEVSTMLETDNMMFALALMYFGVGLLLFVNGIVYIRSMTRNVEPMTYSILLVIAVEIYAILLMIRMGLITDIANFIKLYYQQIPYYAVLVLFVLMLRSDGIRQNTITWNIGHSVGLMRVGLLTNGGIHVPRCSLEQIREIADNGLRGPSSVFLMKTSDGDDMILRFKKTENGNIIVTISNLGDASGVNGMRFPLTGMTPDGDDGFRFYGEKGLFVKILVKDSFISDGKKRVSPLKLRAISKEADDGSAASQ